MADECVNCGFPKSEHQETDDVLVCPTSAYEGEEPPPSDHAYYEKLIVREDALKYESLRDPLRLPALTSKDEELAVTYDVEKDAARIEIPSFGWPERPSATVSTDTPDLDIAAIPLVTVANIVHSTQYKAFSSDPAVLSEIVKTGPSGAYRNTETNEMLVTRGMYGTQIQNLPAGTKFWKASNSVYNQIWVPFQSLSGHSIFATWDAVFSRNWMMNGIGAMKVWQIEGDGNIYFEPRIIWGGNIGGNVGRPPGYDANKHVGAIDCRCYGQPRGATTNNSPCLPMKNQFIVWPDRITRWAVNIELGMPGETMKASVWVSDEEQEPTHILDRVEFTTRGVLNRWRAEFNTSTNYLPEGRCLPFPGLGLTAFRSLISWARNVVILQDTPLEEVVTLLEKPVRKI